MILTTVVYKCGPDATSQYARDMDNESKHDAGRCKQALDKKFPDAFFFIKQWKPGSWTVEASGMLAAEETQAKSFAEGFMASAHLWER